MTPGLWRDSVLRLCEAATREIGLRVLNRLTHTLWFRRKRREGSAKSGRLALPLREEKFVLPHRYRDIIPKEKQSVIEKQEAEIEENRQRRGEDILLATMSHACLTHKVALTRVSLSVLNVS